MDRGIDPQSVLDWYRRIKDACRVVYLHSNNGQADEHLSIRTGRLAELAILRGICKELREDSVVILKYFDKREIQADTGYLKAM